MAAETNAHPSLFPTLANLAWSPRRSAATRSEGAAVQRSRNCARRAASAAASSSSVEDTCGRMQARRMVRQFWLRRPLQDDPQALHWAISPPIKHLPQDDPQALRRARVRREEALQLADAALDLRLRHALPDGRGEAGAVVRVQVAGQAQLAELAAGKGTGTQAGRGQHGREGGGSSGCRQQRGVRGAAVTHAPARGLGGCVERFAHLARLLAQALVDASHGGDDFDGQDGLEPAAKAGAGVSAWSLRSSPLRPPPRPHMSGLATSMSGGKMTLARVARGISGRSDTGGTTFT